MEMLVWNGILSFFVGILLWIFKTQRDDIEGLKRGLADFRLEVAQQYATKIDVHNDIDRVLAKIDRIEEKLDRLISKGM
jgi:hypothetical protein